MAKTNFRSWAQEIENDDLSEDSSDEEGEEGEDGGRLFIRSKHA